MVLESEIIVQHPITAVRAHTNGKENSSNCGIGGGVNGKIYNDNWYGSNEYIADLPDTAGDWGLTPGTEEPVGGAVDAGTGDRPAREAARPTASA